MLFRNDGLERSAPGLRNHFDCPAICRCIRPGTRNPVGRASAKRSLGNRRALAGAGAPAALWRVRPCAKAPRSRSRGLASRSRGRGGIGRHARFRFWWRKPWGFKSLRPHHRRLAGVALIRRRIVRPMQVTETLSEGLKRGFTVVVPAGRHRDPPHRAADRPRQDAAAARVPPRQGAAADRAPALRHRGHRRGAGGVGQPGHPATAHRAQACGRRRRRRSTWSAWIEPGAGCRQGPGVQGRVRDCCRTSRCRISASSA